MPSLAIAALSQEDAGAGTISYGGLSFGVFRSFKLEATNIEDEAGRTTAATEYVLTVLATVFAGDQPTQGTQMLNIRQLLSTPGQVLVLKGLGLGDIQVNGSTATHTDISWGPHPQVLSWTEIHGLIGAQVVWTCRFRIKEGTVYPQGLVAYNYNVTYQIGEDGRSTRAIDGYMQVALSRQLGGKTVAASADTARSLYIRVPVPTGFKRKNQIYRLSPDRTREDFSIVDEQIEGYPFPVDCVNADVSFDIGNQGTGFQNWEATLSGQLETPSGTPPSRAAKAFMLIALDKWAKLQQAVVLSKASAVIPTRIRFGHQLFTRKSRFSMSWTVIGCLNDLLNQAGIWKPLDNNSYGDWAASMGKAWGVRGTAQLAYNASNDAIVDLNDAPGVTAINDGGYAEPVDSPGSQVFGPGDIKKQNSWIYYVNTLKTYRERTTSMHKLATGFKVVKDGATDLLNGSGVTFSQISDQLQDVYQDQSGPTEFVVMTGKAMRIGWAPAIPNLVTVGGQQVEEIKRVVDGPKPFACFFGLPVFVASWAIQYRVTSGYLYAIDSPEAEANPTMCCDTKPK